MEKLKEFLSKTLSANHWKNIGVKHHHGILIPLFSLRTEKSSGIGEFLDLIKVIDWCKDIGFDVIQLLPLNHTSIDASPYNAISSCALNPLYISLHTLEGIDNNVKLKEKLNQFSIFNTYQRVNYAMVKKLKMEFLKEYYLFIFNDLKNNKDFHDFIKNNNYWLDEFCLFKAILEEQNDYSWDTWPAELQNIDSSNIVKYKEKYQNEIDFHCALQYFCFKQLTTVKKYADEKNVLLLGDVPILVSKNSCDVWFNKSFFDLTTFAGVPPDMFNTYGQKWNLPMFNWNKLNKWWKKRLDVLSNFFHMYRIDHAVGFFRIWTVPFDKYPKEGQFVPTDPALWGKNGEEKLSILLNISPLLPIAEDLGSIPEIVYYTLRKLGICGIKVIFWQKNQNCFIKFSDYDSLSITTLSTHDSFTFQGWWESCKEDAMKFAEFKHWNYEKNLTYSQRKEILWDSHHSSSIFHINLLQEYLALYPELIWPDSKDERINEPGTILPTNWTYRFKPSFEEIIAHKNLQTDLKEILS